MVCSSSQECACLGVDHHGFEFGPFLHPLASCSAKRFEVRYWFSI